MYSNSITSPGHAQDFDSGPDRTDRNYLREIVRESGPSFLVCDAINFDNPPKGRVVRVDGDRYNDAPSKQELADFWHRDVVPAGWILTTGEDTYTDEWLVAASLHGKRTDRAAARQRGRQQKEALDALETKKRNMVGGAIQRASLPFYVACPYDMLLGASSALSIEETKTFLAGFLASAKSGEWVKLPAEFQTVEVIEASITLECSLSEIVKSGVLG